jgi:hypothetical protein
VTQQPGSWPDQPVSQPGWASGHSGSASGPPGAVPTPPAVPVPAPPADGLWRPARIDPVPGTDYGLVQFQIPPVTSGPAIGSLVAGIAALGVAVLVVCFGSLGAGSGWGGWVAGAFTLLAVLAGAGAVAVGLVAGRQIRRSGQPGRIRFAGRGAAVGGIVCGSIGAGIAVVALALVVLTQL